MGKSDDGTRPRAKRRPKGVPSGSSGGRLALVGLALVGGFLAVTAQLVQLQVVDAAELSARAERQHHKTIRLPGKRGTITDRNGIILAKNMDVPSISADPSSIESPRQTARALAKVLPISQKRLERRLKGGGRHFAWVYRRAEPAIAERVHALKIKGIHQVPESRRFYPKGKLLGHILGFAGIDNQGLSGVERVFNSQLQGDEVAFVVERDALGRSVFPIDSRYASPDQGADLKLTIDEVIQYHVERELDLAMERTRAESASVVVMAPDTGEILAMAVRPEFDPNRASKYAAETFRNRILTDPYEPGSTLKVFMAATALEKGVVTLDEVINCENGRMPMRGGAMHDSHPHGDLSFSEILVKSSNIGSAKVAMRLGPDALYAGLSSFGFGKRTEIELGGESGGVLPKTQRWSGRSLASIAIGQELSVTPIQLATAAAAVANGGWLMRPYLVKEITDGGEIVRTEPRRVRRVISEQTAADLRAALSGVTEKGGTAPLAAIDGYRVAGKTGTAQKAERGRRGYARDKYVSSFMGMVPAEDPELVILVVIDEAKGKYYGGTVAGPVFREIARPVLNYLGVHPDTDRTITVMAESGGPRPVRVAANSWKEP